MFFQLISKNTFFSMFTFFYLYLFTFLKKYVKIIYVGTFFNKINTQGGSFAMTKNSLLSKLALASLMVFGVISNTGVISASATEIKHTNTTLNQLEQEFDLKPIDQAPEGSKILKFDTPEQAKEFLIMAKENDGKILDLSSLISSNETNKKIIDLSDKDLSEDNFKEINQDLVTTVSTNEQSNLKLNSVRSSNKSEGFDTTREQSILINGITKFNARCNMHISWSQKLGNHISSVNNVTSSFTGITFGNAWSQSDYIANISSDCKSVNATVYGKYSYYLLIDTSLTELAGKEAEYDFTFKY